MKINPIVFGVCLFLIYWLGIYFGISTPKSIDEKYFVIPYFFGGIAFSIFTLAVLNWISRLYYMSRKVEKKRRRLKKTRR